MSAETNTIVPTPHAAEMLSAFVYHLSEDHDIDFRKEADGSHVVEQTGFRVSFQEADDGLLVSIRAPHKGALVFFKEEVAKHVSEVDPAAALAMRWSGETTKDGDLPPNFRILTVLSSREIFAGMQRVTVRMPGLADVAYEGLHLKLMLPSVAGRAPVWPRMGANGAPVWPTGLDALHARYMTIVAARPEAEEIDLDMVRHSDGLVSLWARNAAAGDEIGAMGPAGMQGLPEVERYLLAADLTGLPSAARIIETLPEGATGDLVVSTPENCDLSDYLPKSNLRVHRLAPGVFEAEAIPLLAKLAEQCAPQQAWFAGEFEGAQAARKLFKGRCGLAKGEQLAVAYWRHAHPGFMA
ncbi:DUF2218 domain-containing protein [Yoonia sp. R2-816]|uniref:DUF2218 domain-containing protein n=1 Tax=Yoonia sp. R2-816 TaxID=3342638 RepID=UPI00372A2C09